MHAVCTQYLPRRKKLLGLDIQAALVVAPIYDAISRLKDQPYIGSRFRLNGGP